jgi:hypothetical protein
MKGNARRIEVRSAEGTLLFSVHVYDEEVGEGNRGQANGSVRNGSRAESRHRRGSDGQKDQAGITEAQERFLYTILAERGIKDDAAHAQLKELFGVEYLATVKKHDASAMIKRLLAEAEAT